MMVRSSSQRSVRFAAVGALAALALMAPASLAQGGDGPHPAHIHSGSCAELGDVVVPLTDVAVVGADAERSGAADAIPVKGSYTEVEMTLDDILASPHAVNVHLSADEIGTYIACGDIGGAVVTDEGEEEREVVIGLGELNDSGHTGVAWLAESEDGTGTRVGIYLVEPAGMTELGSGAEATPTS
jgi:hypothetical protein